MTAGQLFTPSPAELDAALEAAANGRMLKDISRLLNVNPFTLYRYRRNNPTFAAELDAALVQGGYSLLEDLRQYVTDLSDKSDAAIARVKLDGFRLYLEKRFPAQFGAKLAVTHEHKVDLAGAIARAKARVSGQVIDGQVLSSTVTTDSQSVDGAPVLAEEAPISLVDIL